MDTKRIYCTADSRVCTFICHMKASRIYAKMLSNINYLREAFK